MEPWLNASWAITSPAHSSSLEQGAPFVGSLTQSLIAVVIIFIFWQSGR